jgi:hypothetical protein
MALFPSNTPALMMHSDQQMLLDSLQPPLRQDLVIPCSNGHWTRMACPRRRIGAQNAFAFPETENARPGIIPGIGRRTAAVSGTSARRDAIETGDQMPSLPLMAFTTASLEVALMSSSMSSFS